MGPPGQKGEKVHFIHSYVHHIVLFYTNVEIVDFYVTHHNE